MKNKFLYLVCIAAAAILHSCSAKKFSTKYYYQNKKTLDHIEQTYKDLYKQKPFTVAFTDKNFRLISLEVTTDSLSYIYEFDLNENRLTDSLLKFGLPATTITNMLNEMRTIRCTWLNNFDYYVDGEKKSLVFLSIKPLGINNLFSARKYYILTYFTQKQYYDSAGRLVNNRRQRQLQELNGEIFNRINDRVSYTVSSRFR